MTQSICIYHNGNSRILDYYKSKFNYLTFGGNWAETKNCDAPNYLWEICFADATRDNLFNLSKNNVHVIRHISEYTDDQQNRLAECSPYNYEFWINHVVSNHLCFADQVICDQVIKTNSVDEIAIITTGRTASSHLEEALKTLGYASFEYEKTICDRLLSSESAILLWREDQWACASSHWIMYQERAIHQFNDRLPQEINLVVEPIPWSWIENVWINMCQLVADHSMFFYYVLGKPVNIMTMQQAITLYQSRHEKISYNKDQIIPNYDLIKSKYQNSEVEYFLNFMYNKLRTHFPECAMFETKLNLDNK